MLLNFNVLEQWHATHSLRGATVRDLLRTASDNNTMTVSTEPGGTPRSVEPALVSVNDSSIFLPEPVLALLGGELIECFGLLFAKKGLMVVLEALIVFVGLPDQLGVLIEYPLFS